MVCMTKERTMGGENRINGICIKEVVVGGDKCEMQLKIQISQCNPNIQRQSITSSQHKSTDPLCCGLGRM